MKFDKIIALFSLLLLPLMVSAAVGPQEVLDKAAQKIKSSGSITAKFVGSTNGTLVASGDKFSVVADGFGIWYNGKDMWSYSRNAGETTLSNPTQQELLESNPLEIIKANSSKFSAAKVKENGNNYTLKLTPKSKNDNIKDAVLIINTSTWLPEAIDITFVNNSHFSIRITSLQTGKAPAPDTFTYPHASYPGIEVVDLR